MKFDHFIIIRINDFNKKKGDTLQREIGDKCIKKLNFLRKYSKRYLKNLFSYSIIII